MSMFFNYIMEAEEFNTDLDCNLLNLYNLPSPLT